MRCGVSREYFSELMTVRVGECRLGGFFVIGLYRKDLKWGASLIFLIFNGQPLRKPQLGDPPVSVEYIQWHREPDKGGVFREPALPI